MKVEVSFVCQDSDNPKVDFHAWSLHTQPDADRAIRCLEFVKQLLGALKPEKKS